MFNQHPREAFTDNLVAYKAIIEHGLSLLDRSQTLQKGVANPWFIGP